jgi:hypothetical protein
MASLLDEKLRSDLKILNTLVSSGKKEECRRLIDMALSFLVSPRTEKDNLLEELQSFVQNCSVNGSMAKSVAQGLIVFLQDSMKASSNSQLLTSHCATVELSEEVTAIMVQCWEARGSQISVSLLSRTISRNKLVDMDWSFGITASTNDCDNVGKPYLHLKLIVDKADDGGLQEVFVELSLEQFYSFLASLEKAKSYVDFVGPA